MRATSTSKFTLLHHCIIAFVGGLWLTFFLVFVAPFDTSEVTFLWRVQVMFVYGLAFVGAYLLSIPLQHRVERKKEWPMLRREAIIFLFFTSLCYLGCYAYYQTELINGEYSALQFLLFIYLPTLSIFVPFLVFVRWAVPKYVSRRASLPFFPERVLQNQALQLKDEVMNLIAENVHLDPEVSLPAMAEKLNTNTSQLSQTINGAFGQNFNDFINAHRIEAFLKAIEAGEHEVHTLFGLAQNCGFQSKSTFNRAFKKKMGISPSEYIKQKGVKS